MAEPLDAGELRDRLEFQCRADAPDGLGGVVAGSGEFETMFIRAARLMPLRGTETVMAARLAGQQPYIVIVRRDSRTAVVTTAWRLVDARNRSRIFNVTAPAADPDGMGQWLDILVVEGKPD